MDWLKDKFVWFAVLSIVVLVAAQFGFSEWIPDESTAALIQAVATVVVSLLNLVLGARIAVNRAMK